MSQFYEIVYSRVSHRELWWWHSSPLVLLSWMNKWSGTKIACASDDPNTETTLPFVVPELHPDVVSSFAPLAQDLAGLGFIDPVYHCIYDTGTQTVIYWATYRHESGKYFARLHRRVWHKATKPNRALFAMFFTGFADGTFLVSSAGKPDLATPATVQMNRMPGAATARLWAKHQQLSSQLEQHKNVTPVNSAEDLVAVTEQHHVLLRDFNLARGVFRPRTEAEQAQVAVFESRVTEARSQGLEHAEVLAELHQLQEKKQINWRTTLWVLAVSLVLFVALGAARWSWSFTLWLIPVLLLHESGHWVAMKVFHYRNLRMFFIPLFGAAVTGRNWNVAGWKKVLVSLAGPLPGIFLGIPLGLAGMFAHIPWLTHLALMLVLINGLNLIPVLPLDGGHVLQNTLFCRNRWMNVAFRVITVFALIILSNYGFGRPFFVIAILMAIGIPVLFRLGKVTDQLRQAGLPPPAPGEDQIPVATAQAIITALKANLPQATSNRMLAQNTITIFETLNARPPGVLATIALLALHGGTLLVAILMGLGLVFGQHNALGDFLRAAANQPNHTYQCGDTQTWPGAGAAPVDHTLLAATFRNHLKAVTAFADLTNRIPEGAQVTLFGDSLLLALPANNPSTRQHWQGQLQALTTNVFATTTNRLVAVNLTCLATNAIAATNLMRELDDYFEVVNGMHLISPWSPEATGLDYAADRRARQDWRRLTTAVGEVWNDPALQAGAEKMLAAGKRNDPAEIKQLETAQQQTVRQLEAQIRAKLQNDASHPIDPALVELHAKLDDLDPTNQTARAEILRQLAPKLGQVKAVGNLPAGSIDDYGAASGMVMRHGLLIEISYASLNDASTGMPALADWLCSHGCKHIHYDLAPGYVETDSDE